MRRKLTLISASAGFGKTTLVSEWIGVCGWPVAWLSLDEGDNDPVRFISYLVKALQQVRAGIGEGSSVSIQSTQPLQTEVILTTLLNEVSTIPENFLLALDDYHLIDSHPVDELLAFIIEHQPPQMHLVISTREDPSLPLARLRARSQLTELRAADLRFTAVEAAEFLNQVMGLNLRKCRDHNGKFLIKNKGEPGIQEFQTHWMHNTHRKPGSFDSRAVAFGMSTGFHQAVFRSNITSYHRSSMPLFVHPL